MPAAARPLQIISDPAHAATVFDPVRLKLLHALAQPASAAQLGRQTGEPRQRINYHLKELEKAGLVALVEERKKGNCVERIVQASARAYLISQEALGALGPTPKHVQDRFSSAYLIAVASQTIRDVAVLREKAEAAGKNLATLTIQTSIRVASPDRLAAMGAELSEALARIAAKYHDEDSAEGRVFNVTLGSYPAITRDLAEGAPSSHPEISSAPDPKRPSDLLKGNTP